MSPGGKPVIYNALVATLGPGDEVVIPAPYWVSYPDMVLLAGGEPVFAPTTAENGFLLQPEDLERAITPRTKWLILNSPSNPSGAAYSRAALKGLADVLLRHPQVWVLTDDMYEHLLYDGMEFATIAQVEPALYERTLTNERGVQGLCHDRLAHRLCRRPGAANQGDVQGDDAVHLQPLLDLAVGGGGGAERAAGLHRRSGGGVRAAARPGRLHVEPGARPALPQARGRLLRLSVVRGRDRQARWPSGTVIGGDLDFTNELLEAEGVAVVQGEAFGLSPFFRISYATSDAVLEDACTRIQRFCGSLG